MDDPQQDAFLYLILTHNCPSPRKSIGEESGLSHGERGRREGRSAVVGWTFELGYF